MNTMAMNQHIAEAGTRQMYTMRPSTLEYMLPTWTMAAVVGGVGGGAAYADVVKWTSSAPPPPTLDPKP